MPSTTPLTDAINALTTYSNTVTGASDTTLSDAVATLAAGYGGGGSGWTTDGILAGTEPSGAITANSVTYLYALFNRNTGITSFTSSTITQIRQDDAFHGCTNLASVEMTGAINQMGSFVFQDCTSLVTAKLPNMTANVTNSLFRGDSALTLVDAGKTGYIVGNAFNGCSNLKTIILRKTSLATLQNTNAFTDTPYANGGSGGTIYVPSALINTYQSASNWSTLYGYGTVTFTAIEGSQYE